MTPERFKAIMNEVKAKTETKGKDLFHPVRIVFTGSHSGPEFDKLIPILEEGSQLTSAGACDEHPRAAGGVQGGAGRRR